MSSFSSAVTKLFTSAALIWSVILLSASLELWNVSRLAYAAGRESTLLSALMLVLASDAEASRRLKN